MNIHDYNPDHLQTFILGLLIVVLRGYNIHMSLGVETEWFISKRELLPQVKKPTCVSCPEYSSKYDECQQIRGINKAKEGMRDPSFREDLEAYYQRILNGPWKRCSNPEKLFEAVREARKDLNKNQEEFKKGK